MKIFISYTSSDRGWAHWIGWQLRAAGHDPFVHDWEVGAGENIAAWMEDRFKQADRLIGVFSDAYCVAAYSQSERWAAYWQDPRGQSGFLVPVEVSPVGAWPALVRPLKRLSIVELAEPEASKQLISFLQPAKRPADKPLFPGHFPAGTSELFTEGGERLSSLPPSFPAGSPTESKFVQGEGPIMSSAADLDHSIRCINDHEPEPQIFGRDDEIETIVKSLLSKKMILVAGGPGMGKTAVTTAAFYDPRIISHFGRRRVFASLEAATEPRDILAKLVERIGLPPTGDEVSLLRILEANAARRPLAAILDNAETVFEADRAAAERLLSLLSQIQDLALAVTIRGVAPPIPGAAQIDDLSRLGPDAAQAAFLAVGGDSFVSDPDLPHLLAALDGHALSIRLIAAQAIGSPSLKSLRESWDEVHAEILRMFGEEESRLTSVRSSLALSLNSKRMKSTPLARRLMALLAFLPGGLAESGVNLLLGERGIVTKARANEAVVCLRQLRLVEPRLDLRLRMLTPLRECVKSDLPLLRDDQNRLIERYLTIATKGFTIGRRDWETFRDEVELEVDNLNPICELAVATNINHRRLEEALRGLAEFHVFSGRGSVGSLEHVADRAVRAPPQIHACCIECLGRVARLRSDYKVARVKLGQAVGLHRKSGNLRGEANCIYSLGDIARMQANSRLAQEQFETARVLYRRTGDVLGEANCIKGLGGLFFGHSDLEAARTLIEEALALYRKVGGSTGEATCIKDLATIMHLSGNLDVARSYFEEALVLNRRIGSVIGEANCIKGLAKVARSSFKYEMEREHYNIALVLDRSIGNVGGEAGCMVELGNNARILSHYDAALELYDDALALYRHIGDLFGEAETTIRIGQTQQLKAATPHGLTNIETGFTKYFSIADPKDRALPGWRAMHRALTCDDASEAQKYRDLARSSWAAISRLDLVTDWIDVA